MKAIFKTLKTLPGALLMLLLLLSTASAAGGEAAQEARKKVKEAAEALKEITAIPEKGIPPALLQDAYAVAVIPGVIKAGFIVGGRWGRGVVAVRRNGQWSDPSFVTITGASIGWQIGAQSIDIVLVFRNEKGIENLRKGKFTLGADAAVAAGPVGRRAEAATDVQLKAEIYSYSRSRGLFAGISLEGASLAIDDETNEDFYGREITAGRIFGGETTGAPGEAREFRDALLKSTAP